MGEPVLDGLSVPTLIDLHPVVNHPIEVDGREFRFTAVSMGNPHCVIYVDDAINFDLGVWGPNLRCIRSSRERSTWSLRRSTHGASRYAGMGRGAGPTLACGTGACATLVSSVLNGLTDRDATSLKGGDLFIEWEESDNHVHDRAGRGRVRRNARLIEDPPAMTIPTRKSKNGML